MGSKKGSPKKPADSGNSNRDKFLLNKMKDVEDNKEMEREKKLKKKEAEAKKKGQKKRIKGARVATYECCYCQNPLRRRCKNVRNPKRLFCNRDCIALQQDKERKERANATSVNQSLSEGLETIRNARIPRGKPKKR